MLRAVKIVLTCRPCSDATPTGKKRDRVWYRDAAGIRPSLKPIPTALCAKFGDAATISRQQDAMSLITGLAASRAVTGRTSPAAAKAITAGTSNAARPTGRFRRFLANSCLPTESTLRADNEIINIDSLRSEANLF